MEQFHESQFAPGQYVDPRVRLKPGVDRFMAGVFSWMTLGLLVTGAVAFLVSLSPQMLALIFGTPLKWAAWLLPLAFVWIFAGRVHTMSRPMATTLFLAYAGMLGVSLSIIPVIYSAASIVGIFGVTAVMFGALALFGYVTKRDMSGWGRFLFMALIGLIVASIVAIFVPGMHLALSVVGVLLFAALTAYDTQKLRQLYLMHGAGGNLAILGALELYLDFVNMFLYLLRLFGNRD